MTNVNYVKGRACENYVANYLRRNGFYVVRSAGSHGVYDLVAICHGRVFGIQCKTNGQLSRKELIKIVETSERYGIIPFLAFRNNRRVKIVNLITSECMTLKQFVESVKNSLTNVQAKSLNTITHIVTNGDKI